jgi:hypothetical protein
MAEWWNKEKSIDISLIEDRRGRTEMHRPDCRHVEAARQGGRMVFNLFGCKGLPDGVRRCECLEKEAE